MADALEAGRRPERLAPVVLNRLPQPDVVEAMLGVNRLLREPLSRNEAERAAAALGLANLAVVRLPPAEEAPRRSSR